MECKKCLARQLLSVHVQEKRGYVQLEECFKYPFGLNISTI